MSKKKHNHETPADVAETEVGAPAASDASAGVGDETGESVELDLAGVEGALAAQREQYVRLAADFDNFRRRKLAELEERSRYASEAAAVALLPVLDNLQRSLEHVPESSDEAVTNFVNGIQMTVRSFEAALENLGVVPIEAVGQPFDPALHEAIGGEESPDVEHDTVSHELQRGYRLHDRVLRPAVVRVAHPVSSR